MRHVLLIIDAFPRASGGDPRGSVVVLAVLGLFPAQAGVIPLCGGVTTFTLSFPRASGGDPATKTYESSRIVFSPRKRG